MSGIQPKLFSLEMNQPLSIAFKAYDVDFYKNAIGIKPKAQNASYRLDLSCVKDIGFWDKALAHPFFMDSYIYFVSKQDCQTLPADLKAIFGLQSIFFDPNGVLEFEIFAKGSCKSTHHAVIAFKAALEIKNYTSQRTQAMSYYTMGLSYEYGIGCKVNGLKSRAAYEKSADLGDVRAQLILGFQEKDKEKYLQAKEYFEKAVHQESAEAMNELGELFYYGLGVEEDYEKAIDLFRQSAQKGYQFAIDNLNNLNEPIYQQNIEKSLIDVSSEDSFVDIEALHLLQTMLPKELPFKKRPIFSHFQSQFSERVESIIPDNLLTQESKKQRMCPED